MSMKSGVGVFIESGVCIKSCVFIKTGLCNESCVFIKSGVY